ncbi:hypothetical protein RB594_009583 [Gaeumannomyces avenae]
MELVVFRGTYNDDALWAKSITLLKGEYANHIESEGVQGELGPDLEWTIIENKGFEGASKNAIRARFLEWVAARSDERDGPGATAPWILEACPRFKYCIYVNRAYLDSITVTRDEWHRGPGIHWKLQGQVVVIDGIHGHHEKDDRHLISAELDEDGNPWTDEEYEPFEGNTNWDAGWTYIDAGHLTVYYEDLHFQGTDWETWEMVYDRKRPSAKGPKRETGDPLGSFDLASSGGY